MWTQVKIQNFRALRSVDVTLESLTVLVGANDSGKSSFLEALLCLSNPVSLTQQHHWRHQMNEPIVLKGLFDGHRVTYRHSEKEHSFDVGEFLPEELRHLERHQLLQLRPDRIGFAEQGRGEGQMPRLENGAGVARFLDHLLRRDRSRFFAILDAARELIPGLQDIEIRTPAADTRQIDLRIVGDLLIPPHEVSEGIRYLLFFLALSFHPDPPSVLLIEEPETGVHPRRLGRIMEAIRATVDGTKNDGHKTQVVLTTHSPYLLDCVDLERDQVLVFERLETGECTAREADRERLKVFLDEFLLGEVWYNEGERGLAGIVE